MKDMDFPWVSKIELTERCNLKCPACKRKDNSVDISDEIIDRIIETKALEATPFVELMMSGESLIHPNFDNIAKRLSKEAFLGVSTNLQLNREQLLNLKYIDAITISFDVFIPEIYEKVRYPGKWDRLIKNFEFMMENCVFLGDIVYIQLLNTPVTAPYIEESLKHTRKYIKKFDKEFK